MIGLFSVRFRITGLNAEKLINEARKRGVRFRGVRRDKSRTLTVVISLRDSRTLSDLCREMGYEAGPMEPLGLLRGIEAIKRRPGLWTGVIIGMVLAVWSLGYVWQVRVENAGPYAGEIRLYLEENGIRPGIRRSAVDLQAIRDGLEWRLPKVKWIRAEWAGVALRLRVEEGTPPPEKENPRASDIVAAEDGVIRRVTAYAGTPNVRPGDLVRKGQVLIRGEERGKNGETVPVKARGEAAARSWITVSIKVPAVEYLSMPAGKRQERQIIETPVGNYSAQAEEDYLICETERKTVALGGVWMPITLAREERTEIWLEKKEKEMDAVRAEAAAAAFSALEKAAYPYEIVDKWIICAMIEGDHMIMTAAAEVEKDIGCSRAWDPL